MKARRLIAILSVALLCECTKPDADRATNHGSDMTDVKTVEQRLELTLPEGTEVLGIESEAAIDDAVRAKLRIPATRAADFLRDCGVKRFRQGGANLLGPNRGFWDPHSAKALRSGEAPLASGRTILIAVDESSSEAVIVYAVNYST